MTIPLYAAPFSPYNKDGTFYGACLFCIPVRLREEMAGLARFIK